MKWVEPDIKEDLILFVDKVTGKTNYSCKSLLGIININSGKYYSWKGKENLENSHNKLLPKGNWALPEERDAVISYAKKHPGNGYRRLTYMMIDEDIAALSPSTVYRILKKEGLLNKWNNTKATSSKGHGFTQPTVPHQHWHIDIKYVNFKGSFLFLISIIDGYSRYIVHHELRKNMEEYDVELTLQKALELFPGYKPRVISDNGSQFISKDFAQFIKATGLAHIRTSVAYPQSNGKLERFNRTVSEELIKKSSLINLDDAKQQFIKYICHYNTVRLHSSLFYLTPEDFLLNRINRKLEIRQNKLDVAKQRRIGIRNAS